MHRAQHRQSLGEGVCRGPAHPASHERINQRHHISSRESDAKQAAGEEEVRATVVDALEHALTNFSGQNRPLPAPTFSVSDVR